MLCKPRLSPGTTRLFFFDGYCVLCNRSVDFILKHDRDAVFRVATLQSTAAQQFLQTVPAPAPNPDTVLLFENGKFYSRATAALGILLRPGFPWSLLSGFLFIPPFLRDAVYRFIARHSYHWFGKRATCRLPTPENQDRSLL